MPSIENEFQEKCKSLGIRIDAILDKDSSHNSTTKSASKPDEPSIEPTFCSNLPTQGMTNGIEPYYARLCATIAAGCYHQEISTTGFDATNFSAGLEGSPKAVIYDNNKLFEMTNPPFVVCVVGTKLILGWRGSHTLMDWDRDFGFYVASSFRWKTVAKVVKVQGAYLSIIDSCMSVFEDAMLDLVEKNGIDDILVTGHSLGGGVAQVAHLWFEGTMDASLDPQPNRWKEMRKRDIGLKVHCMSFEGPMTIVFVKSETDQDLNEKGIEFINRCGANMCTTCFGMDPIPRMYGIPEFGFKTVDAVLAHAENAGVPFYKKDVAKIILKLAEGCMMKKYDVLVTLKKEYVAIARQFQHIGNVLYFASPGAQPKVYLDNRSGVLKNEKNLPQFEDIEFKCKKTGDSAEAVYYSHLFIVCGPGLSLKWLEWYEQHLAL